MAGDSAVNPFQLERLYCQSKCLIFLIQTADVFQLDILERVTLSSPPSGNKKSLRGRLESRSQKWSCIMDHSDLHARLGFEQMRQPCVSDTQVHLATRVDDLQRGQNGMKNPKYLKGVSSMGSRTWRMQCTR